MACGTVAGGAAVVGAEALVVGGGALLVQAVASARVMSARPLRHAPWRRISFTPIWNPRSWSEEARLGLLSPEAGTSRAIECRRVVSAPTGVGVAVEPGITEAHPACLCTCCSRPRLRSYTSCSRAAVALEVTSSASSPSASAAVATPRIVRTFSCRVAPPRQGRRALQASSRLFEHRSPSRARGPGRAAVVRLILG